MKLPKKYEKFDTKWFAELVDEIEEIKYAIEDVKDGYKKAITCIEEIESLNSELEIKIDSLEKAKNVPCIFNNWANFYKGEFISNTILNANSFKKLIKE